jgi:hypothetical protein
MGVELAGRDPAGREDLPTHEDGQGEQEGMEVFAWCGEAGQDADLDVSQAGVTEQPSGAAAGAEVPAGPRVDVGDLGQ